jgi:hypothetical protein
VSLSPFPQQFQARQRILKRRVSFREIRTRPEPVQHAGAALGRGRHTALSQLGVFLCKTPGWAKITVLSRFFTIFRPRNKAKPVLNTLI